MEKIRPVVKLIGMDGNAYFILGRVKKALEKAGMHQEAQKFIERATSGDYDNLFRVVMEYVDVE